MQAVPVRKLRSQAEAQIVAKHPALASTGRKAVQPPVRSEAEKAVPVREPRQVEKPAATTTESPPVTKKDTHQVDEQKRAQQEKARAMESEKSRPVPTRDNVKPEAEQRAEAQGQKAQKVVEKRAEQPEKQADKSEPKDDHNKKGED